MTAINPRSPIPKHTQLREILVALIAGELQVDEPIPSERELSERYGISRMTVRQTIERLVAEGRLYRVPARGTFVARPKIQMALQLTSFTEDMRARGMRPGARALVRETLPAPVHVADALELDPGTPVHRIERLRTADGVPIAIERSHIVASAAPGLCDAALEDGSLYTLLEREHGIVLDAGAQSIEAASADPADAALLEIAPGAAVLLLERTSHSRGRPVEYAVSTYRGDRYRLQVTLDPPPVNHRSHWTGARA